MNNEINFQSDDNIEYYNKNMVVGMSYVPVQKWRKIFELDNGFEQGTIFAELYKPWMVGGNCNECK